MAARSCKDRALSQTDEAFFKLTGAGHLGAVEGAFDRWRIVGKIDPKEIPAFIGDGVALKVEGLWVAVGNALALGGFAQFVFF